jgi:hypothetical protein
MPISDATRRCSRCCEEFAADCFGGTGGYCKECMKEYQRGRYAKRKRQADSESESDGESSDPIDPSVASVPAPAPAPDLYIFSNSLLPGILKIGRSKDVERRRLDMQRSQPFHIITVAKFPGAGHLEAIVHAGLRASLVDGPGREWFRVSAPDAIFAIAIAMRQECAGQV